MAPTTTKSYKLEFNLRSKYNDTSNIDRFAYLVMKQPNKIDYSDEGGPTVSCGPNMVEGRGPKR